LERYIEETELSVNSCEEEEGQNDGGVRRSEGEENDRDDGEGGDQALQMKKNQVLRSQRLILSQIKVGESFINKGMKVQKVSEEIIFVNPSACDVGNVEGNNCTEHEELTKLVVDVEHSNSLCTPKSVLGQQSRWPSGRYGKTQGQPMWKWV